MPPTKPSTFLAESLALLNKSVHQAFADVENLCKVEVAAATEEANEARRERDEAVKISHMHQLEAQAFQKEIMTWKAALKQAEMTIAHQEDTILQLKREATQWKDQSRNWQEHFLRVEQERCALSTRIEELVSEQLLPKRSTIPETPLSQHVYPESAVSAPPTVAMKRTAAPDTKATAKAAANAAMVDNLPPEDLSARSAVKPNTAKAQSRKEPARKAGSSRNIDISVSSSKQKERRSPDKFPKDQHRVVPRQQVIRRVQAVVHVDVKEESDEDVPLPESPAATSASTSKASSSNQSNTSYGRKTSARKIVYDEDGDYEDGADSASGSDSPAEGDDDELMLGAQEDEITLGMKRVASKSKSELPSARDTTAKSSASSAKKRKLPTGGTGRPENTTKTRKL